MLLCVCIGLIAMQLTEHFYWLSSNGLGLLTLAILVGIGLGNLKFFTPVVKDFSPGIQFAKQRILRIGIVLYGFRLTFQDIGDVGILGAMIDLAVFLSTFGLAIFLGVRYFKLDKDIAILIGAGSAICGAAAILATEPVVRAENEKVTVAISTVVIFGTISIFAYPAIYNLGQIYFANIEFPLQFGVYIGSTVHEVAQVLAAAKSVGSDVADTAVITKMMRVMMLGPFLIGLSIYLSYSYEKILDSQGTNNVSKYARLRAVRSGTPWFAFLFLLVIAFNSANLFSVEWIQYLILIDNFLLAAAMAALGLTTQFSAMKNAGMKPLFLASILFLWLVFGGGAINLAATALSKMQFVI